MSNITLHLKNIETKKVSNESKGHIKTTEKIEQITTIFYFFVMKYPAISATVAIVADAYGMIPYKLNGKQPVVEAT